MRNLGQYRNMTDEEFDAIMEKKELGVEVSNDLEKRIQDKLILFSEDYDLTDLKINDREVLRGLIQNIIALEDYEQYMFKVRASGLSGDSLATIDKIQKVLEGLRKSISDAQNDLNITRKIRKSDQETSVLAYIDGLKEKARKFYDQRMAYVYCPKCKTLLATVWTLYPSNNNKMSFVCSKEMNDGSVCGEKTIVSTQQLLDKKGTNNKDVMPEALL